MSGCFYVRALYDMRDVGNNLSCAAREVRDKAPDPMGTSILLRFSVGKHIVLPVIVVEGTYVANQCCRK